MEARVALFPITKKALQSGGIRFQNWIQNWADTLAVRNFEQEKLLALDEGDV